MKITGLLTGLVYILLSLIFQASAVEVPRADFGYQKLVVLFDMSTNSKDCKSTLKREFSALDEILSPTSLKNGGVNVISFVFFAKEVLGTVTVKTGKRLSRDKDFQNLSDAAKRAFASLYRKVGSKPKDDLADVYGALIYSLSLIENRNATVIVVSPGIQNFNREELQPLQLLKNVKKVLFLSHPFECTKYSESFKYKAFQSYVDSYWKSLIRPVRKLELLYSY
jgi:hypothetical protein